MKKYLNIFFFICLAVLFIEILLGFPGIIENEEEKLRSAHLIETNEVQAQQKMQGVHLVESQSGVRDWELFSESAEGQQGQGKWELKKVKVNFYSKDKVDFVITGKSGLIDTKTKDFEIFGQVKVISQNGYNLDSERITYRALERIIRSPGKVKMIGPADENAKGISVIGNEMETDVDAGVMSLKSDVEAKKMMADGKAISIKSEIAEFSSKSNSVRFLKNVNLNINQMRLEGPEAKFQYDSVGKSLESIQVVGGAKISDFDKFATSDTASFLPKENKFVLNGKPRVVQNSDEILGEVITFLNGGKKVKVQNIRAKIDKE
jgi:LPS export ABC transporter protein LptC